MQGLLSRVLLRSKDSSHVLLTQDQVFCLLQVVRDKGRRRISLLCPYHHTRDKWQGHLSQTFILKLPNCNSGNVWGLFSLERQLAMGRSILMPPGPGLSGSPGEGWTHMTLGGIPNHGHLPSFSRSKPLLLQGHRPDVAPVAADTTHIRLCRGI